MFKKNEGVTDRLLRLAAAIILGASGFFVPGNLRFVFWALGFIMLVTAAVGFCPLYVPFKINTAKK